MRLLAVFTVLLLLATPSRASAERRVALVIGNSSYQTSPLKNPANDARDMAKLLSALDFTVILRLDASLRQMTEAVEQFSMELEKGGVGLFFYAGHGVQVGGSNYLVPVDAQIRVEQDVQYSCLNAGFVLGRMEAAGNGLNLIILDACRNNPLPRVARAQTVGLAQMDAPAGSLVAYATAPGATASDGPGNNGLYTSALLKHMQTPGLKVEEVLKAVRRDVSAATGRLQTPWEHSSLIGDFYFIPSSAPQAAQAVNLPTQLPEPKGPPAAPEPGAQWIDPATGMALQWIPGGCFRMGSPPDEPGRAKWEGPVHEACVAGFWLGRTEVTNAQYRLFRVEHDSGKTPQGHDLSAPSHPVVGVSWADARDYARWMGKKGGGAYRLPTEAEWEYAARVGTAGPRPWGRGPRDVCRQANVRDRKWKAEAGRNSQEPIFDCDDGYPATAPVASYAPNAFGLHDMFGNAAEWCEDEFNPLAYNSHKRENPVFRREGLFAQFGPDLAPHVLRGGSWKSAPDSVRSADRSTQLLPGGDQSTGFRLVRDP